MTGRAIGLPIEEMMMSEFEKDKFVEIMKEIAVQLSFLVGGIVLVGLGSNFYLGFGLAALIIYGKTIK